LLIIGLGVASVWLIVFVVFETADRRMPWILAVGITYAIAAYVILPRAIRMGLKILHSERVPRYTLTGDGLPGDPVNLALIGTHAQLRAAFALLGWSEADRLGLLADVVDGDPVERALEVADLICDYTPFAVMMTKEVMRANLDAPSLEAAIHLENRTQILASTGGEVMEAAAAFREKRKPDWTRV